MARTGDTSLLQGRYSFGSAVTVEACPQSQMAWQSTKVDAFGSSGIKANANTGGIQADLTDNPGFGDHVDVRLANLLDSQTNQVCFLLLLPIPVLRQQTSGAIFP